ncbi:hypothetical protein CDN89_12495 [Escherichia coli]|nr:hypothetical protein CDN89_12495 [Escherichia coli]
MSVYRNDNEDDFIRAIESILSQSYSCDLLIYQDGPVNHMIYSAIQKYSSNPSIILFNSPINKGLAHALNTMIEYCLKSHYKYIARMDSDDISREGANKRGNSSRLTQSFHFFMFEPIFSPVNALNQPI